MAAAALAALLAGAGCGALAAPGAGDLRVSVGFADTRTEPASHTFPSPWAGSPRTRYLGRGERFAAGALRIDNPGDHDRHLDRVVVTAGDRRWSPWPAGLTVPAHGTLVLTQTIDGNFATATTGGGTCRAPSNAVPAIEVVAGGQAVTLRDQDRVLTNGGRDVSACGAGNASHQWLPVGRAPAAEEVRAAALGVTLRLAAVVAVGLLLVLVLAAGARSLLRRRPVARRPTPAG